MKCYCNIQPKDFAYKSGWMEVVFLIGGASACGQCERRSTPIIRHTETSLDVGDCAIISVVGSTAGGAADQEVLSTIV